MKSEQATDREQHREAKRDENGQMGTVLEGLAKPVYKAKSISNGSAIGRLTRKHRLA